MEMKHLVKAVAIMLMLGIIAFLIGCGGKQPVSQVPPAEEQQSENKNQPAVENPPAAEETQQKSSQAGPQEGRTVAQIMESVQSSNFLAKAHLDKGLKCENCHGTLPEPQQSAEAPDKEKCLSCHGGAYANLPVVHTQRWGEEVNMHKTHDGELPCTYCHTAHGEFKDYCSTCH